MQRVDVSLAQISRLPELLHPTEFSVAHCRNSLHIGQIAWEAKLDGKQVGIAWDWAEVKPRVVSLVDPMKLFSNMRIQGIDGEFLDDNLTLVYLNSVVFSLSWQGHIRTKTLH